MSLTCCDRQDRRALLQSVPNMINGIDYVEVSYSKASAPYPIVHVVLFRDAELRKENFEIRDVRRGYLVEIGEPYKSGNRIELPVTEGIEDGCVQEGRTYSVSIKDARRPDGVPAGFDPRLNACNFTYNKEVGSEVDFITKEAESARMFPAPAINYLAKDYASFRQLVLDRLAITMPNWRETHAADLGMTLVELLAFVADRISYQQDAVATESYLATARRRPSVRRHARLVDYRMHEGCNARAFLHVEVTTDMVVQPQDVLFTTEMPKQYQIPEGVLGIEQVPPELWSQLHIFEPLPLPLGDWRLTKSQIKDQEALRYLLLDPKKRNSSSNDSRQCPQVKRLADVIKPVLKLAPPLPWIEKSLDKSWREKFNHWLETVDLWMAAEHAANDDSADGKNDQSSPNRFQHLVAQLEQEIWHLPVPHRNRAIVDHLLPDLISAAPILPRLEWYEAHNEIHFYTWDEAECWIPQGATRATLYDGDDGDTPCDKRAKQGFPSQGPHSGDTSACNRKLKLKAGDWLLFEEVKGPTTGRDADADRSHRQVVRLTSVRAGEDPVQCPHTGKHRSILEVQWSRRDALRFPVCVSSKLAAPECRTIPGVSVARGNLVLVDQGRTTSYVALGSPTGRQRQIDCGSPWNPSAIELQLDAFRPKLPDADLTYAQPIHSRVSASEALRQTPSQAVPALRLIGIPSADGRQPIRLSPDVLESDRGAALENVWRHLRDDERYALEDLLTAEDAYDLTDLMQRPPSPGDTHARAERLRQLLARLKEQVTWSARFDLLSSGPYCRHFVVENEDSRQATIRFGDDQHGQQPSLGTEFFASYRIGNGSRGNVGAEMIRRVIFRRNDRDAIRRVVNPLPSQGGTDAETIEQAKLLAPHAYLKDQPRALSPDDYRKLVTAKFGDRVQSVQAFVSTGASFQWVDIAIDAFAAVTDAAALCAEVESYLSAVCKIGHWVTVSLPQRVPIDLRMEVQVDNRYPLQAVRQSIMQRLSNQLLHDGTLGFFHPDRLTFGQQIHSNQIVQVVSALPGVIDPRVTYFGRLGETPPTIDPSPNKWSEHVLTLQPLEIAELDNAGGKAAGRFCLRLEGGR